MEIEIEREKITTHTKIKREKEGREKTREGNR